MGHKRYAVKPSPGFSKNPLWWDYDRNKPCPCGTERKFKRCCKPHLPRYIPTDWLAEYLDDIGVTKTSTVNKVKMFIEKAIGLNRTAQKVVEQSRESIQ